MFFRFNGSFLDGPFTLFAPTDDAFQSMGSNELKHLLAPDCQDILIKTLNTHIIGQGPTLFKRGIKWKEHITQSGEKIQTQVRNAPQEDKCYE